MLISQLKQVRKFFAFFTGRKVDFSKMEAIRRKRRESKRRHLFNQYEEVPQFIFAGATMPSGGRKTALSLLDRFVPRVQLIQTETVHKVVQNTNFDFIYMENDFDVKTYALAAVLQKELGTSCSHLSIDEPVLQSTYNPFKAIVYVNKVSDAEKLFTVLKEEKTGRSRSSKNLLYHDYDRKVAACGANQRETDEFDLKRFISKWHRSICFLRSDVSSSERISTFERFSVGQYNVMITTSLAARGIDVPNVNLIVQFDFPSNVADILHRAGRTGRAGAQGKGKIDPLPRGFMMNKCRKLQYSQE